LLEQAAHDPAALSILRALRVDLGEVRHLLGGRKQLNDEGVQGLMDSMAKLKESVRTVSIFLASA
jgi:hypothetical protein